MPVPKPANRAAEMQDALRADDLRRNRVPMYLQLADIMRRRIGDGIWPVGEQLPTLERLMQEFGVARVTIRQAFDILEGEGLITRRRAKGSFVVKRPDTQRWLNLSTDLHALEGIIREAETRFLISRPADDPPLFEPTEGKLAESYHFLRREITRDGVCYAIVDVWLETSAFERFALSDLETHSITKMLKSVPETASLTGRQTMTISSADAEISKLMNMPLSAPIARVHRVLRDPSDTVIYIADVIYRGEFLRFDIKLS